MDQLLEKLQNLEKYKVDEEKGRKTEETKRKKEIASVKKSLSREIAATKGNVRKRNMEVGKLRQQLAKIEAKQYESAQKKTQTASKLDEALNKADKEHSQLEVELQAKLGEVGEAKGTLAYLEYAKDVLEKGGITLGAEPGAKAITQGGMESINGALQSMRAQFEEAEEHRLALQNEAGTTRVELEEEIDLLRNELHQLREENEGLRGELSRERATVRLQDERIEKLRGKLHMATAEMRQKVARIEELTESVAGANPEMQTAMEELAKQVSVTALVVSPPAEEQSPERAVGYTLPAGYSAGSVEEMLKDQSPERSIGYTQAPLYSASRVEDFSSSPERAVGYTLPSGYSAGSLQEVPATTSPFVRPANFQEDVYEVPQVRSPSPPVPRLAFPHGATAVNGGITAGAMAAAALSATTVPVGSVSRPLTPRSMGTGVSAGAGSIAVSASSNTVTRLETPLTITHGYNANLVGTPRPVQMPTVATARPLSTPRIRPPGTSGNVTMSADAQPRTHSPMSHGFSSPLRPTATATGSSVHRWPTPRAATSRAVVSVPALPNPPYAMASGAPQALRQVAGLSPEASARERGRAPIFAANASSVGAEYTGTRRPASSGRVVAVTATPPVAATSLAPAPIVMAPMTVRTEPGSNTVSVPMGRQRPLSAGATRQTLTSRHDALPAKPERHVSLATRGSAAAAHERSAPTLGSASVSAAPSSMVSETSESRPIQSDTAAQQHLDASGADRSAHSAFADAVHKVTAKALREYRQNHRPSVELQKAVPEGLGA